jgi:YfiH family protein
VKPAVSSPKKATPSNLQKIDRSLQAAGLTRSLRTSRSSLSRAPRFDRFLPEELSPKVPEPIPAANGAHVLQVDAWKKLPWLWHGFSTRKGGLSRAYCAEGAPGELNLGLTAEDARDAVVQNRRLLAEAVSSDPSTPLITLRQFHSGLALIAQRADAGRARPMRADGLMTAQSGILLAIQTADCIPVLVADRKLKVVAAFHAGWRGTVKRIVERGIGAMRLQYGSNPKDLIAAIGPGIGACCYAVGEEVLSEFESQFTYARELFREVYDADPVRQKYPMLFLTQRAPGHSPIGPQLHLDLIEANRRQLLRAGLTAKNISPVGGCTSCRPDLYFSHRAAHGRAGRMMSVIGVRPL